MWSLLFVLLIGAFFLWLVWPSFHWQPNFWRALNFLAGLGIFIWIVLVFPIVVLFRIF